MKLENKEALKLAFEINEWEDFLLVLEEVINEENEVYHQSKFGVKDFCICKSPKYNYPEMIWCDNCGKEIKD